MADFLDIYVQPDTLRSFVRQSLEIEGIFRSPTDEELELHREFLRYASVDTSDLEGAVRVLEPGAKLRWVKDGHGVRVGRHRPLPNGPEVAEALKHLLHIAKDLSPHELYCRYESIHPFSDGNGRSGRLLWLWRVTREDQEGWARLLHPTKGFLQIFHYQTLDAHDSRKAT